MSMPARKRLMRDFKRLQQDTPTGISGAPYDNDIMLWNVVIFGYGELNVFFCPVTGNGVKLPSSGSEEMEQQNELSLKLSELKGSAATPQDSVEKLLGHSQEAPAANGLANADAAETAQPGRCTGARRRKFGSVRRFKQETPTSTTENQPNVAANNSSSDIIENQGTWNPDVVGNYHGVKSKTENSKHI